MSARLQKSHRAMIHSTPMKGNDMNTLKKFSTSTFIAAGAVAIGSLGMAAPASAETSQITAADEQQMRATFDKYLVPEGTQDVLIQDLESGDSWDNSNPDSAPVSVEDWSNTGENVSVERYEDGSITIRSAETPEALPDGVATPLATISGCTTTTGSGYGVSSNCTISHNWVNVNIGFVASYQIVNGAPDSITHIGNTTQQCAAGTCTRPNYTVSKLAEDGNGPAVAQIQSTYQMFQGAGSSEYWVQLQVGNDTMSVHNS